MEPSPRIGRRALSRGVASMPSKDDRRAPAPSHEMTIGVSHDLDTGNVVLVVKADQAIYDFAPNLARSVAAELRSAARAEGAVLIVAKADDGRQIRLGGNAAVALNMAADIEHNADLGQAIKASK